MKPATPDEPANEVAASAKATRACLIRNVYGAQALECTERKGPMRVIALLDDTGVVRLIPELAGRQGAFTIKPRAEGL